MSLTKLLLISFLFAALFALPVSHAAKRLNHEKYYQQRWCDAQSGRAEVVLPDRTRVDCITDQYAVEVDFANKWAESIGQSLHYGRMTGKPPAVLLIIETPVSRRFIPILCGTVAATQPRITVFLTGPAAPPGPACPITESISRPTADIKAMAYHHPVTRRA